MSRLLFVLVLAGVLLTGALGCAPKTLPSSSGLNVVELFANSPELGLAKNSDATLIGTVLIRRDRWMFEGYTNNPDQKRFTIDSNVILATRAEGTDVLYLKDSQTRIDRRLYIGADGKIYTLIHMDRPPVVDRKGISEKSNLHGDLI